MTVLRAIVFGLCICAASAHVAAGEVEHGADQPPAVFDGPVGTGDITIGSVEIATIAGGHDAQVDALNEVADGLMTYAAHDGDTERRAAYLLAASYLRCRAFRLVRPGGDRPKC